MSWAIIVFLVVAFISPNGQRVQERILDAWKEWLMHRRKMIMIEKLEHHYLLLDSESAKDDFDRRLETAMEKADKRALRA